MNKSKFKSRKFWVTVGMTLLTVLNGKFGLGMSESVISDLVMLALGYLGSQGLIDWQKTRKEEKVDDDS